MIDGIAHNIPFLTALMRHDRWRTGELSTGFIAEEYPDGFHAREPDDDVQTILVGVAAAVDHLSNERRREITDQMDGPEVTFTRERVVQIGQQTTSVLIESTTLGQVSVSVIGDDDVIGERVQLESPLVARRAVMEGCR